MAAPQVYFPRIAELLPDHYYLAVDFRGFGGSGRSLGIQNYAIRDMADDIEDLILKLEIHSYHSRWLRHGRESSSNSR